jgi:hypothetical protein
VSHEQTGLGLAIHRQGAAYTVIAVLQMLQT